MSSIILGLRKYSSGVVIRYDWPTNSNLNYLWCSGSFLLVVMGIQLVSGIFCAMSYINLIKVHLYSVSNNSGEAGPLLDGFVSDLVRFIHLWGASLLFFFLLIHVGRGLYYSSYSKNPVLWSIGMVLYVVILVEAFLGYLLPWHQMSYWAGIVISTIFLSFPLIGEHLYSFLLGSYDFGDVIISRVFCVHVSFGFVIIGLIFFHLVNLHYVGSGNSFNSADSYGDFVFFHKGYGYKDLFCFLFIFFFLIIFINWFPWESSLKENFISPNPLLTPSNIKPEWYFLPFYAVLRSVENKIGGILFVLFLFFLVWIPVPAWSSCFDSFVRRLFFWVAVFSFIFMCFLGANEPTIYCQVITLITSFLFCLSIFWLKFFDYLYPYLFD
nr:cytochrome b [Eudiplozoon nipponicum]WET59164.1 cytochrome b [Eudiplozoon nipponicum]